MEVLLLKSSSSLIPLEDDLVETIVGDIKYDTSNRGKRKLTDEIKQRVAEIIESEIMKTKYLGKTHKQKLTATQIHELLLEERFDVGLTTVTNYVRELRKSRETYFRQEYT